MKGGSCFVSKIRFHTIITLQEVTRMKKFLIPALVVVAALAALVGCAPKPSGPITLWAPGLGVVGPTEKGTEYGNTLEANVKFYLDNHKNITLKQDVLSGTG